jgi:hypothetical protein
MTYAMNDESAQYHAEGGGARLSAPLGDLTACRLELTHGAGDLRLRVASDMPDLYRVWHDGPQPKIALGGDLLTMRFVPDWSDLSRLFRGAMHAVITLNGAIPWTLDLRGGASTLDADLRGLDLRGLDVRGGASRIEIRLPQPRGACPLFFTGGATVFGLHRPAGTAARLRVSGGFSTLTFDDRLEAKVGGTFRMETSGFEGAADYYDVDVTGGASKLTIDATGA